MCLIAFLFAVNNNKTRSNKRKGSQGGNHSTSETASKVMKLVSFAAKIYGSASKKRELGRESSNSQINISEKPVSKVSRANSIGSIQEVDNKGDDGADNDDFDMGAVEQGFVVVEPKSREIDTGIMTMARSEKVAVGPLVESKDADGGNEDCVEAFDGDNAV